MKEYYQLTAEETISHLNSTPTGLSSEDAIRRLEQNGKNSLPKGKQQTITNVFFSQFKNTLVLILLICAIVSYFAGEKIDTLFIIIVILTDAIVGTIQEWHAEQNANHLQNMMTQTSKVLRDKKETEIKTEDLVIGDIIIIESGDKIGADARIIEQNNLSINESILTGESLATTKNNQLIFEKTNLSDQTNMCFCGTTVMTGRGKAIITNTGTNTEIGKIAHAVINHQQEKTPLVIRMEKFTKQISYLIAIIAIILTFILYLKNYAPKEIFFTVIALAISAIPEGLPVSLTIALSIASNRMAKRNVIVRKLNAVESLGSCTVIASDKTGTLTLNEQTAKKIILPDESTYEITGQGYNNEGTIQYQNEQAKQNEDTLNELIKLGIINNEAFLEKENNKWNYHGDAIDIAFQVLAQKKEITTNNKILKRIPYESENKYAITYYQENKQNYITMKGSNETVLNYCQTMIVNKQEVPIDKQKIEELHDNLAKQGYRIITIAKGKADNLDTIPTLTLIGLTAFIDPIRKESKQAIDKCKKAGIKVIMITGDHPLTATTIAKELNLIQNENQVATGKQLEMFENKSEQELDQWIQNINVFSRVTPNQKLTIVESYKRLGEFIAVTGDGVNDAPAMKSANIGIAMGSGTDVAKETSSMIITDDNFLSIVAGVEEGRYAYNNIRKVVYLLLSCGISEVLFFTLAIIFNLPMPLVAIQLLWLNLVTNGIQDVALAFEKGDPNIMKQKPRNPKESIFNSLMIKECLIAGLFSGTIVFILWHYLITQKQMDITVARSYILMLMVLIQNIHTFNCRSETVSSFKIPIKNNPIVVLGVLGTLILQLIMNEVPFLSNIIKTTPLSIRTLGTIFLLALPILLLMELFKIINKKTRS